MKISRRDVIVGSVSALGGIALSSFFQKSTDLVSASQNIQTNKLKGKLFLAGEQGGRLPGGKIFNPYGSSVITQIDIATGEVSSTHILLSLCHSVEVIQDSHLLCTPLGRKVAVVLDFNRKRVAKIESPAGTLWSGHSVFLQEQNKAVISFKAMTSGKQGGLAYIDPETYEISHVAYLPGMYPHDVKKAADSSGNLVIGHGADYRGMPKVAHYPVNENEPMVSVFDPQAAKIVSANYENKTWGLNHIATNKSGTLFSSQVIATEPDEEHFDELAKTYQDIGQWTWGSFSGLKAVDKIPKPAAIYGINKEGKAKIFFDTPKFHLRHQDTCSHSESDSIFLTYSESNVIARITKDEQLSYHDAYKYGLTKVRGVREIPGSEFIVISDNEFGVAIVNAHTMDLVQFIKAKLYFDRHITYYKG